MACDEFVENLTKIMVFLKLLSKAMMDWKDIEGYELRQLEHLQNKSSRI